MKNGVASLFLEDLEVVLLEGRLIFFLTLCFEFSGPRSSFLDAFADDFMVGFPAVFCAGTGGHV